MPDEIIKELWGIKDGIAREHGCDIDAFVAHLRARERSERETVVDLHAMKRGGPRHPSPDADTSPR